MIEQNNVAVRPSRLLTGIREVHNPEWEVAAYPNPVSDVLTLSF